MVATVPTATQTAIRSGNERLSASRHHRRRRSRYHFGRAIFEPWHFESDESDQVDPIATLVDGG